MSNIQELPIESIAVDGDTQIRQQMDWIAVDEYVNAMNEGATFPPVDVFFDDETYWLSDGFHRIKAAQRLNHDTIAANVQDGSKRDAILHAIEVNTRHGVRLTNRDKRRIVEIFLQDEEWAGWMDTRIAHQCGVSSAFVGKVRKELEQNSIIKPFNDRKVIRNGTTYTMNTAAIGKTADEPEPTPARFIESLREADTREATKYAEEQEEKRKQFDEDSDRPEWLDSFDKSDTWENKDEPEPTPEPPTPIPAADTRNVILQRDACFLSEYVTDPVQLVITSPPYNVDIDYDSHTDNLSTYFELITQVWHECYEVMEDGARLCCVVPFGVGRNPWVPLASKVMDTITGAGFTLRGQIIWDKNTSGNRTTWGSFRLPSDPGLRDTTECVIVAHKNQSKLEIPDHIKLKDAKGTYSPFLALSEDFMEMAQDHWVIAPESAQRVKHPAPFPVELARRLMRFYAYPGATILDPFGGSGSTAVAAIDLGCNSILFDVSEEYCGTARERCDNAKSERISAGSIYAGEAVA